MHDTIGGACSQESNTLRYGHHTRNSTPASRTSCSRARWGLGKRDLASNINWFMNVPVEAGRHARHRRRASRRRATASTLRAEMDVLVVISNCPQINNPCNGFDPTPIRMIVTGRGDVSSDRHGAGREPRRDRRAASSARSPHWACDSVAVFSDADRGAPHVRLADEAVRIGPAPRPRVYLRRRRDRSTPPRRTGAGAVHPGYGFLVRERRVRRGGRGGRARVRRPDARADPQLRRQGHRPRRRARRRRAAARRVRAARRRRRRRRGRATIGFPLLVKASPAAAGSACRRAATPAELPRRLRRGSSRLAAGDFGSPAVFLERLRRTRPPRRGAGVRRRRRPGREPRRPRLLAAAPPPEGGRGGAGAGPPDALRDAAAQRVPRALRAPVNYRSRRHGRVRLRRRHAARRRSSR